MAVKFTKEDVNAVANSRFYRKTGVKYLMLMAIVVMGILIVQTYWRVFPLVFYAFYGIAGIIFVYLYSKRQSEVRKQLWEEIQKDGIEPHKE